MTVSPSVTLRQLAEVATKWLNVTYLGTGEYEYEAHARLIALAPALAVWSADAADALDEIEGSPEDPLHVQKIARSVLARLGDLVGQEPTA